MGSFLTTLRESFSYTGSIGNSSSAQVRLKIVLVLATRPEFTVRVHSESSSPSLCAMVTPSSTTTVSLRLNRMLTTPTRFASGFAPMEQTMAVVTQSPR